jgi:hypothetical protein
VERRILGLITRSGDLTSPGERDRLMLGLAAGLLAVVTAGAALATRQPGTWRAG